MASPSLTNQPETQAAASAADQSKYGNFALDPDTARTLEDVFTYHAPDESQIADMQMLRKYGLLLARAIMAACPRCADRSAAIRHVREAIMTANAAIVLQGRGLT